VNKRKYFLRNIKDAIVVQAKIYLLAMMGIHVKSALPLTATIAFINLLAILNNNILCL